MPHFTDGQVVELTFASLILDDEIQTRARGTTQTVVDEYARAMRAGNKSFPPIDVFSAVNDSDEVLGYFVADGFHRVKAAHAAGLQTITCRIHLGDKRAAILFAVGANSTHGLRRTNADKRRAVELLLCDPEWGQRSGKWVADQCGVDETSVRRARARLGMGVPKSVVARNRWGAVGVMKVADMLDNKRQPRIEKLIDLVDRHLSLSDICDELGLPPKRVRALVEKAKRLGRVITLPSTFDGGDYVPHPPRGPTDEPHYIPEGHELGGVSTLTDSTGELKEQWSKTRVAGADKPPTPIPESFLLDKASVMRRGDGSTVVEWSSYKRDAVAQWESIKAAVAEHAESYARPAAPLEAPTATDSDRLVVYPLGDPHIGMLAWANEVGESFDLRIAERELCECMSQLVARSPSSMEAIITNLGDFWHAQDDAQRTPKDGNKLDVDGRSGKVGRVGLSIFRTLVDACLMKHEKVKVRSIPGNHDPNSAFWLPIYIAAVYRNDPRVTVEEGFNPYQYDVFGSCLLGWAHGDGAKLEQLGEIMATDEPEKWGAASFRYWNTGHVHHWSSKELRGCVVDTHRTLAGRDAWHHHSGYRSGRALKAITYHRLYGLDSIAVVGVERVRAAIEARK